MFKILPLLFTIVITTLVCWFNIWEVELYDLLDVLHVYHV